MLSVVLKGLSKSYGDVAAVRDVSLEIAKGEFFFLLGPSGCGKTTLLRMIAGFADPDAGQIRFGDRLMNAVPAHRRNTGMVFQNYALWPHLSVRENIAYGLELRRVPREELRRRLARVIELVRLRGLEERRPNQLSGGQQQRVALARALVIEPDVLLLDEPLSNLDAKLRVEMRHELRRIHAETAVTTLYVTHDQKEALSLAARLAVMCDGQVRQAGTPREIYTRPVDRFVAEFIGQANVLLGDARPADGETVISTPYGKIRARGRADLPAGAGGKVTCCIRPEALILGPCPDAANRLRGTVKELTYLGDQEQVVVRLSAPSAAEEEINLLVPHPTASVAAVGETIEVCFGLDDVILVSAEPPAS
jgi:iron(III) transport system ATP-binding protein